MKQVCRTGILFLVYGKSPNATIFNYTDSVLVLSDIGSVLYSGTIHEAKQVLYDKNYDPQPNYNSMDCLYHIVTNLTSISHSLR